MPASSVNPRIDSASMFCVEKDIKFRPEEVKVYFLYHYECINICKQS